LFVAIVVLVIFSGYFSGSETALMALDRYRLRNAAKSRSAARLAERLLRRPDRLLGVILIGNNLVNFIAASLATLIGLRLLGETVGTVVTPIVVTLVFLVFAEVTPKTVAAYFPERVAFFSVYILRVLLRIFYPLVVLINAFSNLLARLFGVRPGNVRSRRLSVDELRTVMNESAEIDSKDQDMLLGVLDLNTTRVRDIMIPKASVVGIDMELDMARIRKAICDSKYTRMPIYEGSIDRIIGVLHMRNANRFLISETQTREELIAIASLPYFVPEQTSLTKQVINFQKDRRRIGLVVNEYGDILGIVTLEDILERIVGDFTGQTRSITSRGDGSWLIAGTTQIHDINRELDWSLPTDGPSTLSGLIIEHLQVIPQGPVGLSLGRYRIETVELRENRVESARVIEVK